MIICLSAGVGDLLYTCLIQHTLTKSAAFWRLATSLVSGPILISTLRDFVLNLTCSNKCSTIGVKIFNQFSFSGVYL